jgi:hypothetical protein
LLTGKEGNNGDTKKSAANNKSEKTSVINLMPMELGVVG